MRRRRCAAAAAAVLRPGRRSIASVDERTSVAVHRTGAVHNSSLLSLNLLVDHQKHAVMLYSRIISVESILKIIYKFGLLTYYIYIYNTIQFNYIYILYIYTYIYIYI